VKYCVLHCIVASLCMWFNAHFLYHWDRLHCSEV